MVALTMAALPIAQVGDARFARLFSRTFPRASHHWALQVASDAVPHLPFRAWGFEHPEGVAVLSDAPDGAAGLSDGGDGAAYYTPGGLGGAEAGTCMVGSSGGGEPCLRRTGDPGDSVACMRPREGNAANWATCHDLRWYMSRLHSALGDGALSGTAGFDI